LLALNERFIRQLIMLRKLQVVVLSDLHLGTYGCHANELVRYLEKIDPETLILNGDIIDIWQFNKRYWPASHHKVVSTILQKMNNGTKVYYITGNHDETLRRFTDFELGNLCLCNKVILDLDGKKTWFFHGDVFDVSIHHSKWLAKLGGKGYDLLILINRFVNYVLLKLGRERISLSKKVKQAVKQAVKFIDDFENTAIEMAVYHGFDAVVCGHIHQAQNKEIKVGDKSIHYLNSGDWVETLSALEYNEGMWQLHFEPKSSTQKIKEESVPFPNNFEKEISSLFFKSKSM